MKWRPAALLPLILAMWACAEGGIRGSGISTAVQGNVVAVSSLAREVATVARARTLLEGIRVTVEGTDAEGETDANGVFSLRGNFDGMVSVRFDLPDATGHAQMLINVPGGGTLTLNDVHIDTERALATAETQHVEFQGLITAIDCAGATLTLTSIAESGNVDEYILRLENSTIRDPDGGTVPCRDLQGGEQVAVEGVANPDGTFGNAIVQLDNPNSAGDGAL